MPAFSYTSGNINNLAAGVNASMADIQGSFADVRTALGGLDEVNVPNLAAAFTHWKTILWGGGAAAGAAITTTATYLLYGPAWANANGAPQPVASASATMGFYLDPADWTANARATRLRLRWRAIVGGTAPGTSVTVGLYPITAYSGASPVVSAVGAAITGSTATFTTPAANSATTQTSSEFTAPAAGDYALAMSAGAAFAAGTWVLLMAQMQMRQV